jgi:hypothetical protein
MVVSGASPRLILGDWKSPNPQTVQQHDPDEHIQECQIYLRQAHREVQSINLRGQTVARAATLNGVSELTTRRSL